MHSNIFQENAEVIKTTELADNTFETVLLSPEISQHVKPGQFINILPKKDWVQMMRRPLSVASQKENTISIIYKFVGEGTEIMRNWLPGDIVDILGPLGNFWQGYEQYIPILIGGGVGIAPIINLKNHLDDLSIDSHLIMGARTDKEHFLDHDPVNNIYMTTDDGSLGVHGTVIDALNLIREDKSKYKIFACGPPAMMEAIKIFADKDNIICDLAIETIMACGIGICQGCTVELNLTSSSQDSYREKYALACIDGPIFKSKDLKTCYL